MGKITSIHSAWNGKPYKIPSPVSEGRGRRYIGLVSYPGDRSFEGEPVFVRVEEERIGLLLGWQIDTVAEAKPAFVALGKTSLRFIVGRTSASATAGEFDELFAREDLAMVWGRQNDATVAWRASAPLYGSSVPKPYAELSVSAPSIETVADIAAVLGQEHLAEQVAAMAASIASYRV